MVGSETSAVDDAGTTVPKRNSLTSPKSEHNAPPVCLPALVNPPSEGNRRICTYSATVLAWRSGRWIATVLLEAPCR